MSPAPAPFRITERVRWSDCDPAGIIRFDAYTRFMELGESEMFRALGVGYAEFASRFGITLPRRVMHMEYPSPPRLDEALEVEVYISHVGRTSLHLNFDVYGEGGALRMAGHLVLICAHDGPARGAGITPCAWPEPFLRVIAPVRLTVDAARTSRAAGGAPARPPAESRPAGASLAPTLDAR